MRADSLNLRYGGHIITVPLKVPELLERYASATLQQMARPLLNKVPSGKSNLVRALSERLSDAEALLRDYRAQPQGVQQLLYSLDAAEAVAHSEEGALAVARGLGLAGAEEQLRALLRSGLALAIDPRWAIDFGRSGFLVVPSPALPELPPPAVSRLELPAVAEAEVQAVRRAEAGRLGRLLHGLLDYAQRSRLRVNKDGWMAASHIGPLARALSLEADEELVPLPMLLTIALSGGLLHEESGLLRPAPGALALLQGPLHGLLERLLQTYCAGGLWRDDAEPGDPRTLYDEHREHDYYAPHFSEIQQARATALATLRRLAGRGWVRVDDLAAEVLRVDERLLWHSSAMHYNFYSPLSRHQAVLTEAQKLRQRTFLLSFYLRTCMAFGLVEAGSLTGSFAFPHAWMYQPDGPPDSSRRRYTPPSAERGALPPSEAVIRLSALGRTVLHGEPPPAEAVEITVGADYEIIAPLDRVSAQALYRLGLLAERLPGHPDDPVARFRLKQDRWVRALQTDTGTSAAQMIETLAAWSGRPLPDNVARALRDWSSSIDRLQVFTGFDLIELDSAAERDAFLAAHPAAGARGVGAQMVLVPSAAKLSIPAPLTLDYLQPPVVCLAMHLDGRIDIDAQRRDFLIDAELEPFTEAGAGPGERRLTVASVKGWKSRDILARLAARGDVPEGLELAVQGWCGEVPALPVGKATVLQTDPDTAHALMRHADVAAAVAGQLAGGILVVKDLRALKRALARLNVEVTEDFRLSSV